MKTAAKRILLVLILSIGALAFAAGCRTPPAHGAVEPSAARTPDVQFAARIDRMDATSADVTCTLAYPPRKPRALDQPAGRYLLSGSNVKLAGLNGTDEAALPYEVITVAEDVSMTSWSGTQDDYRHLFVREKDSKPSSYAVMKIHVFSTEFRSYDQMKLVFDGSDTGLNVGRLSTQLPLQKAN